MACGMPEQCGLPSLDSCQRRFAWAHKEVDLALYPNSNSYTVRTVSIRREDDEDSGTKRQISNSTRPRAALVILGYVSLSDLVDCTLPTSQLVKTPRCCHLDHDQTTFTLQAATTDLSFLTPASHLPLVPYS